MSKHHCHDHHHGSCSSHGESCNCGCHDESCACECHKHHHHHEHEDFAHELIEMADEAWMEVLREKIKKQVEASSGKNLDQLAKLVAEANQSRWKSKLALNKAANNFRDKVSDFFNRE